MGGRPRARRFPLLLLAWVLLLALLLAVAGAITIFGKASDGDPSVAFNLAPLVPRLMPKRRFAAPRTPT